jgi:AraC-like DNA-binding protein
MTTSEHTSSRLLCRTTDGALEPMFDLQPVGVPSPSQTFIIEHLRVEAIEWKTLLLPKQLIHLFLQDAEVGFSMNDRTCSMRIRANQIGVCPRDHWHSILWSKPVSMLSIQIDDQVLASGALDSIKGGRCEWEMPPIIDSPQILHLLMTLRHEQARDYPNGELFVDSIEVALGRVLLHSYGTGKTIAPVRNSALQGRRLRKVLDLMHANLDKRVTLKQLARSVELSPTYFAEQFRCATGHAPHQYLLHLRVDMARALLKSTRIPILEVALRSGFPNQQHFATTFKRLYGVSPNQYRMSL